MKAAAAMEWNGTPIDADTLAILRDRWADIQDRLIAEVDSDYGVFDGRTFKEDRWDRWLAANNIPWPRKPSGELDLDDRRTFRQMAKAYPKVSPMRELRSSLADLRLNDLRAGDDGRNRTILSAFRSRTGRNQPSNTQFIFGPAVVVTGPGKATRWLWRGLRRLEPTGDRHRGGTVGRSRDDGCVPHRRLVFGIR